MNELLAVISLNGLVGFVITALVIGTVCFLLVKAVSIFKFPYTGVVIGIIWIIGIFLLIYAILGFVGMGGAQPLIRWN